MKIRYILSLLTVAFLLGSCATPKVAYFTDLKRGTAEQVLNPLEIRIRPEDKISIQVNSKDPLLMNLFNLPIISRQIGTTSGTSNSQGISGYTINSRPLKSAHLRNIVRKQYPADFFNKPQKSPHGSFEVVCGGS